MGSSCTRWLWLMLPAALLSVAQAGTTATDPSSAAAKSAHPAAPTRAEEDKTLYELGVLLSRGLDSFQLSEAEFNQVKAGIADGYHRRASDADAEASMPKVQALEKARSMVAAEHEKVAGRAYLAKAAEQPGARKMASGLLYVPIAQGSGATPTRADQVKVNYEGRLIDGTVFDSSSKRGQPADLSVAGVIPCWSEALQLMKVGDKSRIICPADLAYGDHGALPKIKPGATLVFDVELLGVLAPTPASGPTQ
jgi:FKBP-type peptidyl-prolyl cis-trans isomerase FkpA